MAGTEYDVIIIGAGPSGIFAALELSKVSKHKILIIEKGHDIHNRFCPAKTNKLRCLKCQPCSIISGWGGAGAFSDGKLTLTADFGGFLREYVDNIKLQDLINYVDRIYLDFGAPSKIFGADREAVQEIQHQAIQADLSFIPSPIRHLGTENCYKILERLRKTLDGEVEILTDKMVKFLIVDEGKIQGVELDNGNQIFSNYVICGPGRGGSGWFFEEATRLGLKGINNPVDIGVRVEVPAVIMEHLTKKVYESKLIYFSKSFDDRVRTFCMNPYGEVVTENNEGLITVNGHSYAGSRTPNTNFALLVSKTFTDPFNEPIQYGRYVASLANMLTGGVIVQRLGDLMMGRRSTVERIRRGMVKPTLAEAVPGDLSLALPYRHLLSILEMLESLDRITPGVNSRHTLLYGVEVKFYSFRLNLTDRLETDILNLFAVGDGAGITRGIIQASVSGVLAAKEIKKRLSS